MHYTNYDTRLYTRNDKKKRGNTPVKRSFFYIRLLPIIIRQLLDIPTEDKNSFTKMDPLGARVFKTRERVSKFKIEIVHVLRVFKVLKADTLTELSNLETPQFGT